MKWWYLSDLNRVKYLKSRDSEVHGVQAINRLSFSFQPVDSTYVRSKWFRYSACAERSPVLEQEGKQCCCPGQGVPLSGWLWESHAGSPDKHRLPASPWCAIPADLNTARHSFNRWFCRTARSGELWRDWEKHLFLLGEETRKSRIAPTILYTRSSGWGWAPKNSRTWSDASGIFTADASHKKGISCWLSTFYTFLTGQGTNQYWSV